MKFLFWKITFSEQRLSKFTCKMPKKKKNTKNCDESSLTNSFNDDSSLQLLFTPAISEFLILTIFLLTALSCENVFVTCLG